MQRRCVLVVLVLVGMAAGCKQYSYPEPAPTAASINYDLIAARTAPLSVGKSMIQVRDLQCSGADYTFTVYYEHDFIDAQSVELQYQTLPPSITTPPTFTQPMGVMTLAPETTTGEVGLTIPAADMPRKGSDVLLRLKIKSPTVLEYISSQEEVHVEGECQ